MSEKIFELEFDKPIPRYESRLKKVNPMVLKYGADPNNRRCKDCKHLQGCRQSKVWYKCLLRGVSHSEATDHRVNWEACSKFEEE